MAAVDEIELVMAGVRGRFAIEDFLGAGEIISYLKKYDLDEMAQSACLAIQIRNWLMNMSKTPYLHRI